ncbi:hypothetical protein SK128_025340, partial [Halocaridina rubra]
GDDEALCRKDPPHPFEAEAPILADSEHIRIGRAKHILKQRNMKLSVTYFGSVESPSPSSAKKTSSNTSKNTVDKPFGLGENIKRSGADKSTFPSNADGSVEPSTS